MFFLCVLSPTPVKRVRIGLSLYSYIFVIDGGPKGVGSSRIWGCTFRAYILLRCVKPIGTHGYILREIICTSMVI